MKTNKIVKPVNRSILRLKLGTLYYGSLRKLIWIQKRRHFASHRSSEPLVFSCTSHQTPLLRKLKDVDMWLQRNKVINLKIAVGELNGIVIRPNEVFSYWKLIGKPTKRKGYVDGMVLHNGSFIAGTGGGLCQIANMIFWMTIHTPLTIVERHRHGYDIFPDSNRTQPFGSGATCYYPHIDLMIRNDTDDDYQINLQIGNINLEGEIRSSACGINKYKIVEKNHEMKAELWGGYSRHNELYQQLFDLDGRMVEEHLVVSNSAVMTYAPFIENNSNTVSTESVPE